MDEPFGSRVYAVLRSQFGPAVLGRYADIQQLKTANREATLALLFGAHATTVGSGAGLSPEDVAKRVIESVQALPHPSSAQTLLEALSQGLGAW